MKAIGLIVVLLALGQSITAYSAYQRPITSQYTSGYSSHTASSGSCCQLNAWAYQHLDAVRQMANRLRQEYNHMSQGSTTNHLVTPWNDLIIHLTGKTGSELDAISRRLSEQLVTDMRKGAITYTTIAQPNFFESKAAEALENFAKLSGEYGQQQIMDIGHYQPVDLSNFDEVRNYAYPAEVKVIDGKTYVVHKNCTEATKSSGQGTFDNPLVTVYKRNRTSITSNAAPFTTDVYGGSTNNGYRSSARVVSGASNIYPAAISIQPGGTTSTTTVTRKKTIYDWVNENVEPSVIGYKPVINLGSNWAGKLETYKPPVHIPVENSFSSDVEAFTGNGYQQSYNPGSTVTIRRVNKTIITNNDGTTVHGSESNKKWVDGKLVYDSEHPFGQWNVPRDEEWKREERERFYWFLGYGAPTVQRLEEWQRQQEERLLAMAERYHTTIEEIQEWHRKELERYHILLKQYQAQSNDLTGWQRRECGRLDWLIHQNSVTREELERWQRENQDKLAHLAKQYRISLNELKNWQFEELNRLYVYFNNQNNSMLPRPNSDSLRTNEQQRLEELIRQHNATISQLQNSIKLDQQKLIELSKNYKGNVQDMENWLKSELARLGSIINEQRNEMTRITEWQRSERERLENIVRQHQGSVEELQTQMARDRNYIQSLASKYHVSIEELEKWQRSELDRLHIEGQTRFESDIKEWQQRERDRLMSIINKNDLSIEELHRIIGNDRARLEELAKTYKVQVTEIEEWIKNEINNFQSQGLLKEVEKELTIWQQKERDRLLAIVQQNELTVEEMEKKIKTDQSHLYNLANTYQVRVEEIEAWLKNELKRLQGEGLIKVEDLKDWQKSERQEILKLVQQNKYTIEEFERKLLADRQRLADLAKTYNVQTTEIESWIKKEGERLQSLGLLQIQEQLNNWQKIERDRLLSLINKNNLSIEELEEKIKKDQVHLYSLAHQHQVRVEEIEEWIKKEIKRLQQEGVIEMERLKDWQTDWRGNLTSMVKDRDFTVEEFHKWLVEDRARLYALAMKHNVQIEEIEQWIHNEEQRFVSMGLLKPNEKLTNWQEVERRYLERITQEQYHSTEQLEHRLRQDRELLEKLARQYSVQVEEIEKWMKKELARLRDDGQLQIDNLTAWQIAERERLEQLIRENKKFSVEEFEQILRKDREHMQKIAFQYHTSVEEIEKWIKSEVERLRQQGKLDIEKLTAWQRAEQQRILNLLQQQSIITVEEFERKVQNDRNFVTNLAAQYHVNIVEVEEYVKKVIADLRDKGKFEVDKLQNWQVVERDYIKQLIAQYNNNLPTAEYERKLLSDRSHLNQLADQYRISIDQIEKWMIAELQRLRQDSANQVKQLSEWQVNEIRRLKELIRENTHLTYVDFEVELLKEHEYLQKLAQQYSLNVAEVEQWLRQQLLNLKTTGQVEVENLTKWQEQEQTRLIELLLQQQNNVTFEEFETQLHHDRARLQQLAQQYSISVEQIESWMRDELQRLKNSGLLQVEQLTYWQKIERDRLQNWLKQQNNEATYEEFKSFLTRDKDRLQRIAQEYHVTVEEVESWVQQEGARLSLLGHIQRPESLVVVEEVHDNTMESLWKEQTRGHLQAIAQFKPMHWDDFERYLTTERSRWEQFARQYNITVEEIEFWLRQVAQDLANQGLIHGTITIEEWEGVEDLYIQNLINDKLRKQQKWSIEELERKLINDREHLNHLEQQYRITIEEIEAFYKKTLNRLLNERKITTENLLDWQRREKDRIYWIVRHQPDITLQSLEQKLLGDTAHLNQIADEYHLTIEELEIWIRNELQRLVNLGLIQDLQTTNNYKRWQQQERERLHAIAAEISITEEEFLEFISGDNAFQQQLSRLYGCTLNQLVPFQRIEIGVMQREHLLDNTKLLTLENWQKRERDRLYTLIKNQNFSLKNLQDWQRQEVFLSELAGKYSITTQTLKDWQIQEYKRLMQLADNYQMTLNQLQDYREKELRYLTYVMHKIMSTESERIYWGSNEAKRMEVLERKADLSGEELLAWRRKLYLQCQGLIPIDYGGFGGHESGVGSTNRTALPTQNISKDRGDQPPNVYEENIDNEEPGIAGQEQTLHPLPPAEIRNPTTTQRPAQYLPPLNTPVGGVQSGYRYSKKEYKFTVPIGTASASATGGFNSASATASVGIPPTINMESHSLTLHEQQQQSQKQQRDVASNDFGQTEQDEPQIDWSTDFNEKDYSQQQIQEEENLNSLRENHAVKSSHTFSSNVQQKHEHYEDFGQQQQVEVEDLNGGAVYQASPSQNENDEIVVNAVQEPTSFWGKLKKKTTDIFG